MKSNWKRLAKGIALGGLTPCLLGSSDLTVQFEARVLAAHNRERSSVGTPALQWSGDLEKSARLWADHLSHTGRFEHAPVTSNQGNRQGENLWAGTRAAYSPEEMVDGWIAEKRLFKPGRFPANSRSPEFADVGHYTQLIWRKSTAVGCALSRGPKEDILVCRYAAAGNVIGESPL
jgi:hypothetical protein